MRVEYAVMSKLDRIRPRLPPGCMVCAQVLQVEDDTVWNYLIEEDHLDQIVSCAARTPSNSPSHASSLARPSQSRPTRPLRRRCAQRGAAPACSGRGLLVLSGGNRPGGPACPVWW